MNRRQGNSKLNLCTIYFKQEFFFTFMSDLRFLVRLRAKFIVSLLKI